LDIESWQIAEIKQAISEADTGDFASDAEFNVVLKKHAG
jgi:predicted transcriptional regulator